MTGRSFRLNLAELVASFLLLIVGTAFVLATRALPPALYEPVGPAVFPAVAGMAIILLSLIVLARALLRGRSGHQEGEEVFTGRRRNGLALLTGVYTIAYIAVMDAGWLGFRSATVIFVLAIILTLSSWRPLTLVFAVAMALFLGIGLTYLFTNFFYIDLPS